MGNAILKPERVPLIAPSILSADFGRMAEECAAVLCTSAGGTAGAEGGDLLHLDVMDGHFVPNLTMGPDMCRAMRKAFPKATLDVHLMVTDPGKYVGPFGDAGASHLSFHVEPADPTWIAASGAGGGPEGKGYDISDLAGRVRSAGMSVGLAVNPSTPVEAALRFVKGFDLMLVMSVNPGYSGQAFIEGAYEKARRLRAAGGAGLRVEMDGGVSLGNADKVRKSGADVLVAASAVFGAPPEKRHGVITLLRGGD